MLSVITSVLNQQSKPSEPIFDKQMDELSEVDLLALLMGPGNSRSRALAQAEKLMRTIGSLSQLSQCPYHRFRETGFSHERALALMAVDSLARRQRQRVLFPGQRFGSSRDIFDHFQPRLEPLRQECFWSILLNGKNRLIRLVRISQGSLTTSLAHPREVFRPAIEHAAASVLFVHNHPSGDPQPSQEDLNITRRLVEAGRVIGIGVLDHVIIGGRQYFSFADEGLL